MPLVNFHFIISTRCRDVESSKNSFNWPMTRFSNKRRDGRLTNWFKFSLRKDKKPGLPTDIHTYLHAKIWVYLEGPRNGKCRYILLEYFTTIWHVLWHFGILCSDVVYFLRFFGMLYQEKSGNPARNCAHLTDGFLGGRHVSPENKSIASCCE
jgi:hypothetical protein